jgi:hypothetical protein
MTRKLRKGDVVLCCWKYYQWLNIGIIMGKTKVSKSYTVKSVLDNFGQNLQSDKFYFEPEHLFYIGRLK